MTLKRHKPLVNKTPMPAGKQLRRKAKLRASGLGPGAKEAPAKTRRSRVRPRNVKRKSKAYARNYGGPTGEHADMVRSLPCAVCWTDSSRTDPEAHCQGPTVAAHAVPRGMGGAHGCWADLVNLCAKHHDEAGEDRTSARAAFQARYRIDLRRVADDLAAPVLGLIARQRIDGSPGIESHNIDALFGWIRRRKEDPDAWSVDAVGRALGLFANRRTPTDAEFDGIVRLCAAAMESR